MFNINLEPQLPTYAEWKAELEKIAKDQPELAKKYQDHVQKFWKDFFKDAFKV